MLNNKYNIYIYKNKIILSLFLSLHHFLFLKFLLYKLIIIIHYNQFIIFFLFDLLTIIFLLVYFPHLLIFTTKYDQKYVKHIF